MGTTDTRTNPWDGVIEASHLKGEYWFIQRYPRWAWAVVGFLLVGLPPLGAFVAGYMALMSVQREGDELDAELE